MAWRGPPYPALEQVCHILLVWSDLSYSAGLVSSVVSFFVGISQQVILASLSGFRQGAGSGPPDTAECAVCLLSGRWPDAAVVFLFAPPSVRFALISEWVDIPDQSPFREVKFSVPFLQIIEESEERLKDEEVEEILSLVKTMLPGPPEEADADAEGT